tara:strand:- start:2347 stop:3351 length:1005 start_codon:yes stop_codon:yes gene_type:complete
MNKKNSYITWYEKLSGHIRYWKDFIEMVISVSSVFNSPNKVLWNIFNNKFPLDVKLKDNAKITLESFNALYLISKVYKVENFEIDSKNDEVTINFLEYGKEIIFHGGVNNGDIANIFVKNEYDFLKVKNKTVLDIGANIGDTAIFFACRGANKIIGVEPFHKNFNLAKKNISSNNFQDKIYLTRSACSSKNGSIKINPQFDSGIESKMENSQEGEDVPMITIRDIIDKYSIPKCSILKIDCEGCEYDIIENISSEVLAYFDDIQIEYHQGYRHLKEKLESYGYDVRISKPHATNVINTLLSGLIKDRKNSINGKLNHEIGYAGFLYASKNIDLN